jgi:hypothetical protein
MMEMGGERSFGLSQSTASNLSDSYSLAMAEWVVKSPPLPPDGHDQFRNLRRGPNCWATDVI